MSLGIPALYQNFQIAATSILTTVSFIKSIGQESKIYSLVDKDGNNVLKWDSCVSFTYDNSYTISDAPQEEGAFISYNKVSSPFIIKTRGTSLDANDRKTFVEQADTILASLEIYDFITPERVYRNCNVVAITHAKTAQSSYSIAAIDFIIHEVVLNNLTRTDETATPSGAKRKSTGQVVAV